MFTHARKGLFLLFCIVQYFPPDRTQGAPADRVVKYVSDNGEVDLIWFSGDPEWLVKQKDPRSHWHNFPRLSAIALSQHDVSPEEIAYIATLKGVVDLEIGFFPDPEEISVESLSEIEKIPHLKFLKFWVTDVKKEDWSFLSRCTKLEDIFIGGELDLDDACLRSMAKIKSLKRIHIDSFGDFTDCGVQELEALVNLEYLHLMSQRITDKALESIAKMKNIETLDLPNHCLTEERLSFLLARMPKIKEINSMPVIANKMAEERE